MVCTCTCRVNSDSNSAEASIVVEEFVLHKVGIGSICGFKCRKVWPLLNLSLDLCYIIFVETHDAHSFSMRIIMPSLVYCTHMYSYIFLGEKKSWRQHAIDIRKIIEAVKLIVDPMWLNKVRSTTIMSSLSQIIWVGGFHIYLFNTLTR